MEGGEQSIERDEVDSIVVPLTGKVEHLQVYDVVEGTSPRACAGTRNIDGRGTEQVENAGVMGGRAGGIRNGLDPQFDGGLWGKCDLKEKVSSGA